MVFVKNIKLLILSKLAKLTFAGPKAAYRFGGHRSVPREEKCPREKCSLAKGLKELLGDPTAGKALVKDLTVGTMPEKLGMACSPPAA